MLMVNMSHWSFHRDFIDDIFVLQVQKRPGACIAGCRNWEGLVYSVRLKLTSLYPVNCFLQSVHITSETLHYSVVVWIHRKVRCWVSVSASLFFPVLIYAVCSFYRRVNILITAETRAPGLVNVCRWCSHVCSDLWIWGIFSCADGQSNEFDTKPVIYVWQRAQCAT